MKDDSAAVQGCMNIAVKDVIRDLLYKRMAELDKDGLQASRFMKILNEIDGLPSCIEGEKEADSAFGDLFAPKQSKYTEFTSKCMKEKKNMRECAEEWKKMKSRM